MKTPSLDATDKTSKAVQKTANRVSLENIKAKIKSEQIFHPECAPHMTIAILEMANGFVVIGKAAPADAENFDVDVGKQFAREDAIRQIWPLEGYALREVLSQTVEQAPLPDEPDDIQPNLEAHKVFKKSVKRYLMKNSLGKEQRDIPQNLSTWEMRCQEAFDAVQDKSELIKSFAWSVRDDFQQASYELQFEDGAVATFDIALKWDE